MTLSTKFDLEIGRTRSNYQHSSHSNTSQVSQFPFRKRRNQQLTFGDVLLPINTITVPQLT